ncbi:hypothetical protein D3C78_1652830 [compost metagenome]
MVVDVHDHLALLAVDHELIGTGDTRAVEQGINGKGGVPWLDGFEPEGGKVRELFGAISVGIQRQTTGRKAVLVGIIYRAEVARAKERDDVATRQLRRLKGTEARKT